MMNALIVQESRGLANAISETGALGMMQMTSHNYLGNTVLEPFNPLVPAQAVPAGVALMGDLIGKYGTDTEGLNKALAAYNQGESVVNEAIQLHGQQWLQHIPEQGRNYVNTINAIRSGQYQSYIVPGYFGNPK